ncbi:MAG: flippase-like domain-containing protein [Magnetococcales bacterium]|nr:flippase-like domain-containing protein [Magnetococcales bacterium]
MKRVALPSWLWLILKLIVAGGLITLLWQQGILDPQLLQNSALPGSVVLAGLLCNLAMISLGALRWQILLASQGLRPPFAWSHGMVYLTFCFNLLVPGSIGGDALRMAYLLRECPAEQKSGAILTILADRICGLYAMFLLALLAALANLTPLWQQFSGRLLLFSLLFSVAAAPLAAALLFWGLDKLPRWPRSPVALPSAAGRQTSLLDQLLLAVRSFRQQKKSLLAAVLVSVLAQSLEIVALLFIASALGLLANGGDHFFLAAPVAWIANLLPVSPGGLGVGEAAFAHICQWLQPETAVTALGTPFLINRLLQMIASLPGIWVYLRHRATPTTPS